MSVELGKNRPVRPLGLVNKTYIIVLDWLPYGRFSYDEYDVPDTMNVHGIYDMSATMQTSESWEFQKYLQQEAGVSESYFGFHSGARRLGAAPSRALSSSTCLCWMSMWTGGYRKFHQQIIQIICPGRDFIHP